MVEMIYAYPPGWVGFVAATGLAFITCVGIIFFRPLVRRWLHAQRPANEMVVAALNSFAVIYGILIGLIAVEVYQNYSAMGDLVSKEASSLSALYRDASAFPAPIRGRLQDRLRAYAKEVVEVSWPLQKKGIEPSGEMARVTAFYNELMTFTPTDKRQELLFLETLRELTTLSENRRARLNNMATAIPAMLWWVVLVGGAFHVVLIWLFDMEEHVHIILGGMLSAYIGLVTAFIAVMDRPFQGAFNQGPTAIEDVVKSLMTQRDAQN